MRVTLQHYDSTVEVGSKFDDLDIWQVRDQLLIPLLLAAGFHPDNVNELFDMGEVDGNREGGDTEDPDLVCT